MDQQRYKVTIEDFAKRHFIKNFEKKYKNAWTQTLSYIIFECQHIQNILLTKRADLISTSGIYQLIKLDFAIFGTKVSPKSSGNRCILTIDNKLKLVRILLVYSKGDISSKNETQEWKRIIKNQFSDIREVFSL